MEIRAHYDASQYWGDLTIHLTDLKPATRTATPLLSPRDQPDSPAAGLWGILAWQRDERIRDSFIPWWINIPGNISLLLRGAYWILGSRWFSSYPFVLLCYVWVRNDALRIRSYVFVSYGANAGGIKVMKFETNFNTIELLWIWYTRFTVALWMLFCPHY